jgi:hypothetical protein
MASSTDPKPSKKRVGRHRQPPLAPGPPLQFVVASHPDEFKTGKTMRRVRSHVMYTHREGLSPTETARSREGSNTPHITTRTPSPATTVPSSTSQINAQSAPPSARRHDTVWEQDVYEYQTLSPPTHPVRLLAARIYAAISEGATRNEPPVFEGASEFSFPRGNPSRHESLEDLKREWIRTTTFYCYGTYLS